MLTINDPAPHFTLPNQSNEKVSLNDYRGKKLVLYFYPEDNTPLCTEQSCNLRDNYSLFQKHRLQIVGINSDSVESHSMFIKKFHLPFTLLVDADKKVMMKYGVWAEKIMFGNRYMGIKRMTFLINEKGNIEHIIKQARAKSHTQQIVKLWKLEK